MKFDPEVFPILEKISNAKNPDETRAFAFDKAIDFYEREKYFEAHEVFEFQWKKEKGELKTYIQALIQISVAMNKIYINPNKNGAISQSAKAMEKLKSLLESPQVNSPGKDKIKILLENLSTLQELFEEGLMDISSYSPPSLNREWRILG